MKQVLRKACDPMTAKELAAATGPYDWEFSGALGKPFPSAQRAVHWWVA